MAKTNKVKMGQFELQELLDPWAILNQVPVIIFWKDLQLKYLGCNQHFLKLFDLKSPADVIGKTAKNLALVEAEPGFCAARDKEILATGKPRLNSEETFMFLDKKTVLLISKIPIIDKTSKKIVGILGAGVDITERKSAEQAFLEAIIARLPGYVFWKDLNSRYLGCNDNLLFDAGLKSKQDILGKTDKELPWQDHADNYQRDDKKVMKSGFAKSCYEETLVTAKNEKVIVLTTKTPLKDANEKITGVLAIASDITERKKLERALEESKEKAESANRAKTEFLSQSVNDLKKPLEHLRNFIREKAHSIKVHKLRQEFEYISQTCQILENTVSDIKRFADYDLNIEHTELTSFVENKKIAKKLASAAKDDLLLAHKFFGVSKRESHCLYYLMRGMTGKQIAKTLKLSPRTVEFYLENAKLKLKCQNRHELINKMFEAGLV